MGESPNLNLGICYIVRIHCVYLQCYNIANDGTPMLHAQIDGMQDFNQTHNAPMNAVVIDTIYVNKWPVIYARNIYTQCHAIPIIECIKG